MTCAQVAAFSDTPVPTRSLFDRHLWLVLLLSAAIVLPRSYLIAQAQSERIDDEFHLIRGVAFCQRQLAGEARLPLNDPPLGEAIGAIPNLLTGCIPKAHDY